MKTRGTVSHVMLKKEHSSTSNFKLSEIEKHRANIRTILLCSNATLIRCRGEVGYACSFCAEQFLDPADLKTHTIQSHDRCSIIKIIQDKKMFDLIIKLDITKLRCKLCDTSVDTLKALNEHLVKNHDKIMYSVVKDHILPFTFDDSHTIRCVLCSKVYNKFKGLLEHMSTHFRNYVCVVCDSGYVNRNMLSNHAGVHKTGEFKCTYCDKVCDTYQKKKSHEKYVHVHFKLVSKCGSCNLKFKDHRRKEEHMAKVHGVILELKCQACDKILPNQKALAIHTKRDHLMERPHKCLECDMSFFKAGDLKDHLVKHSGAKSFQCSVCLKAYGRRKTLVEHMKIHTNDSRFKCEHCRLRFIQKCSLIRHVKAKHSEIVNKD